MSGSEPRSALAAHGVRRRVEELMVASGASGASGAGGRVADLAALSALGVLALLQPARWGGLEVAPVEFTRTVRVIAEHSTSLGWSSSQLAVNAWQAAQFPEEAQTELWAPGATQWIAAARAPLGRIRRTAEGSYQLSGQWRRSVGAAYAQWFILAALEVDPQGRPLDIVMAMVARDEVAVAASEAEVGLEDDSVGSITVERALVPAHRLLRAHDVMHAQAPGRETNTGPLHALPWSAIFGEAALAPILGAAVGALASVLGGAREHVTLTLGGASEIDSRLGPALARAHADVDAALLQTERNLEALYAAALAGEQPTLELRARTRRDQVCAAERAVAAVDGLFAVRTGLPGDVRRRVETVWRDVHTANQHAAVQTEPALEAYGSVLLGRVVEDEFP